MPTLAPVLDRAADLAAELAADHWRANRAALARRQPAVAAVLDGCDVAGWATARDGSLTTRSDDGRWFAGCSVPRLAGRALLRTLAVEPGGHCLLAPAHGGLVAAARERLGDDVVLFVIQPDADATRVLLGSNDWSADLSAGRLWLATGPAWADQLRAALDDHPGLAAPSLFVRTKLTADADVDPLVADAQRAFGDIATRRQSRITRLLSRTDRATGGPLAVVRSRFRLWDVSGCLSVLADVDYDLDDPLTGSPLALAEAAAECGAVLSADLGRGDAAAVVPAATPWVTWVTLGRVPAFELAGPADQLILADAAWIAAAADAGWPGERVRVGQCPPLVDAGLPPTRPVLSILADTGPIVAGESVRQFSTHQLLWDAIAAELHDDPSPATDPAAFLSARATRMGLDLDALDAVQFLDGLIGPAFVQGLARQLLKGGLPVRLWGEGWADLPEFANAAAGPLTSREQFAAAVTASTALVRPTPADQWHPVAACERPVLTAGADLVRRARAILSRPPNNDRVDGGTLAAAVEQAIRSPTRR